MYPLGMGIYHSGVEVYGMGTWPICPRSYLLTEFAYGGHDLDQSGIFQLTPKYGIPGLTLRYDEHLSHHYI